MSPGHTLRPPAESRTFTFPEEVFLSARFNTFLEMLEEHDDETIDEDGQKSTNTSQAYTDFFHALCLEFLLFHRPRRTTTRARKQYEATIMPHLEDWFWGQYRYFMKHCLKCSGCD